MSSVKFILFVYLQIQIYSFVAPRKYTIPDFLTVCPRNDPKLNDCLIKAFSDVVAHLKDGIPELGIPSLEPFKIDEVAMDLGTFKATFRNVKLYNASKVELVENEIDYKKLKGILHIFFPSLYFEGDYEVSGKLLLLEMNGKGHGSCTISKTDAWIDWKNERITKKNKIFLGMANETKLDVKVGSVNLVFGELFKNNPQLEQITNQVINDNLEEFTNEIKPVALDIIQGLTFGIVKNIFASFTEDELFPKK